MYEQNRVSVVGRIIWLIVSALVIIGLVWFILWLIFGYRSAKNTVKQGVKTTTSKVQQSVQTGQTQKSSTAKSTDSSKSTVASTSNGTANSSNSSSTPPSSTSKTAPVVLPGNDDEGDGNDGTESTPAVAVKTPATSSASKLAQTGPADNAAIVFTVIVGSSVAHYYYNRRKFAR